MFQSWKDHWRQLICRLYMQAVHQKKYNDPGTKSFEIVKSACLVPLIEVKLNFALTIARQLQPFLMYQGDEPLLPFLVPDLLLVVKGLLERFLTSECLSKIKRPADLQMEAMNNSENQKESREDPCLPTFTHQSSLLLIPEIHLQHCLLRHSCSHASRGAEGSSSEKETPYPDTQSAGQVCQTMHLDHDDGGLCGVQAALQSEGRQGSSDWR